MVLDVVVQAIWAIFPAYASNVLATLVGGGPPIDGGRLWRDGRRILGDGKTWRGIVLAPLLASVVTAGLWLLQPSFLSFGVTDFGPPPSFLIHGYALALGALVGDVAASFIKRRLGKERGARWLGPDQYDFIAGALVFALLVSFATAPLIGFNWFLATFTAPVILVILILTPGLHLLVNVIGYWIGVKEVPW